MKVIITIMTLPANPLLMPIKTIRVGRSHKKLQKASIWHASIPTKNLPAENVGYHWREVKEFRTLPLPKWLSSIIPVRYFERRCAKCGAKYNVIIKPATYCIETQESPSTCSAKKKPPLQIIIDQIQQQPPSTCTTGHQLLQLQAFAQRLGMHDAADVIDKIIENAKRKP